MTLTVLGTMTTHFDDGYSSGRPAAARRDDDERFRAVVDLRWFAPDLLVAMNDDLRQAALLALRRGGSTGLFHYDCVCDARDAINCVLTALDEGRGRR
jgi:hypothetical protein